MKSGEKERLAFVDFLKEHGCPEMTPELLRGMILEAQHPNAFLEELRLMMRMESDSDVDSVMQLLFEAWEATPRAEFGDRPPSEMTDAPECGRVPASPAPPTDDSRCPRVR